jgi:hypothetical protein
MADGGAAAADSATASAAGADVAAADAADSPSGEAAGPKAAEAEEETTGESFGLALFPPQAQTFGVVWVPLVGHRTEDGVGAGLEGLLPFTLDPGGASLPSDLKGSFYYTEKHHKQFDGEANLYWDEGRHYARGRFQYSDLAQRFWGIGADNDGDSEVYRPRESRIYGEFYRSIDHTFRLGLRAEYVFWRLLSSEEGGEFTGGGVPGQERSEAVGGGLLLDWDTRDRRFQPESGFRVQGFALFFVNELGGDHEYSTYNLEWRGYHGLGGGHVLASQVFYYAALGEPPFWRLAELGGRHHSRGYRRGRYRDNTMVAAQLEWRFPVAGILRGVLFGGVATVADGLEGLQSRYLRPTAGTGLRFPIGSGAETIPIRCDVAVGQHGLQGYLGIGDAF